MVSPFTHRAGGLTRLPYVFLFINAFSYPGSSNEISDSFGRRTSIIHLNDLYGAGTDSTVRAVFQTLIIAPAIDIGKLIKGIVDRNAVYFVFADIGRRLL